MNLSRYTVTLDRATGAVAFNDVVIEANTTRQQVDDALRPLIVERKYTIDGDVQYMLGPGTFVGLECSAGPIWELDRLSWIAIIIHGDFRTIVRALAEQAGIVLRGQESDEFPWGTQFYSLTKAGNFVIIHVFAANAAKAAKPKPPLSAAERATLEENVQLVQTHLPKLEMQLASPATAAVAEMLQRLTSAGFDETAAKAMFALLLGQHVERSRREKRRFDYNGYIKELAGLTQSTFRD